MLNAMIYAKYQLSKGSSTSVYFEKEPGVSILNFPSRDIGYHVTTTANTTLNTNFRSQKLAVIDADANIKYTSYIRDIRRKFHYYCLQLIR
jgi:hypothetical protein